jgi:hypothetical protein
MPRRRKWQARHGKMHGVNKVSTELTFYLPFIETIENGIE